MRWIRPDSKIPPGEYILTYEIKGNVADVRIIQDQQTVASTMATVGANKDNPAHHGVVKRGSADGTARLKEIQFATRSR